MVASGTRKSYSLLQIFLHFEECNRLLYTWANPPHRIMSQCRVCPYDENKCEKWSVESYEVAYRHLSFSNHETCWCTKMVRIITVLTLQMTNRDKWDAYVNYREHGPLACVWIIVQSWVSISDGVLQWRVSITDLALAIVSHDDMFLGRLINPSHAIPNTVFLWPLWTEETNHPFLFARPI